MIGISTLDLGGIPAGLGSWVDPFNWSAWFGLGPARLASITEWLDPQTLIERFGSFALIGVIAIIFAECGLLIGFFLPGDSLLFIAGMLVAQGYISQPIALVLLLLCVAAVAGNLTGYWIGFKVGPALFNRPDSRFFKQEYVAKTHSFFEKHGPHAVVLARFVPIVRTFITAVAGVGKMDFRKYALYSAIGGVLWAAGVTLLGYFLGNVNFVREHIELMLLTIVLLSLIPIAVEYIRHRRELRTINEA